MIKDKVIVACDFPDATKTLAFLSKFGERKLFLKIGMELFYSEGKEFLNKLISSGHEIFLDLKICDIPRTVFRTVKNLLKLKIKMLTIHAFGGSEMILAASEAAEGKIKVIAVTVLTSITEEILRKEILFNEDSILPKLVLDYAKNAKKNNADGVVCSAFEAKNIKEEIGDSFLTITPGIRNHMEKNQDQKRVTTPKKAKIFGSDYIVVGSSITYSHDPLEKYKKMLKDFQN
jgi:orotidine-5'-phosphate decarboxylase